MLSSFASKNIDQEKVSEKSKQVVSEVAKKPGEMVDQAEKVHIPDSFDESDADSETLSDKLRHIDAYTEVGQGSKQNGEEEDHQIWHMEVDEKTECFSCHECNAKRSKLI